MSLQPVMRGFAVALFALLVQSTVKSCGPVFVAEISLEQVLAVGPSAELTIESASGPVHLERGPAGHVTVLLKLKIVAGSKAEATRLAEQLREDPPIAREGETIRLGDLSKYKLRTGLGAPSISVGFDLRVPEEAALEVKMGSGELSISHLNGRLNAELTSGSANVRSFEGQLSLKSKSGRLVLANLRGLTTLESTSGAIYLNNVRGDLSVATKSGSIELDSEMSPGAQWHFQTQSGDISLALPADSSFLIYGRSESSKIKVDFPLTTIGLRGEWRISAQVGADPQDRRLEIITQSGAVQVARQ